MAPSLASFERAVPPVLSKSGKADRQDVINSHLGASYRLNESYKLTEEPIGTRRRIRVVCLGAGYSGLMMGILHNERMKHSNVEFVIYERNEDLGGTWFENRYPGCKCDIPAHNYSFSFAPNPSWPNYYATSEEIHRYMKDIAKKYEVEQFIRYRHSVCGAIWREDEGKWAIEVQDEAGKAFTDICDVFINASGVLNNWKWPDIKGIDKYQGRIMHSARWDSTYDFSGKKVACIGIGSSGIQIVPQLAKVVRNMDCYVRSQTWISPGPGINEPTAVDPEMDDEYNFSDKALELFKDPEYLKAYRSALMDRRLMNFNQAFTDSIGQKNAQLVFRESMTKRLGDSEKGKKAAELILPNFPIGCRRLTPGPGFLEAIVQDNIEMRWDDIAEITERGIRTRSGVEIEYDIIVCATGFDTSFRPAFPIIGRNGVNMAERWKSERPKAYFSLCVPEFPNYFCPVGPNAPLANGSLILAIQAYAVYIYKWLDKMQTEGVRSFDVRHIVNEEFNQHVQEYMKRTVWAGNCRSWYKQGTIDGPVISIYAGTIIHMLEALKNPRWEDFHMDLVHASRVNRFAYLGNGFSVREEKGGSIGATQTIDFDRFWDLFVLPQIHD